MKNAILLISCPDKKGINAAVSNFIYQNNGNIQHSDQHIDQENNTFFMRIEWSLEDFKIAPEEIENSFQSLAEKFKMSWSLHFTDVIPQIAIFVSRKLHCLYDLLLKHKSGYLRCRIPFIVSNHPHAEDVARFFGIKFIKFPITKTNKAQQEKKQLELLKKHNIELIVLARYMQVLSEDFVNQYPNRIINIHHSFLPAFAGKNPYQQAYKRGVKIIGATSHYVTKILDSGPIIEQEITKVGHQDSVEDLKRKGTDLERVVLGRSVRAYLERKILAYNNKTVVFG